MTAVDRLLMPKEVGPLLRESAKTVRLRCASGEIRHVKFTSPGGRVRYLIPESAVEEFRRVHTVRRTP